MKKRRTNKLEWGEFHRTWKLVHATVKISESRREQDWFERDLRMMGVLVGDSQRGHLHHGPATWQVTRFMEFAKRFKGYLKCTDKDIKDLYLACKAKRDDRTMIRSTLYRQSWPSFKERIYPLSEEKYKEWAEQAYERRGKPTFGKKIITGVRMGEPLTHFCWYRSRQSNKVDFRYLGLYPMKCRDGLVRLILKEQNIDKVVIRSHPASHSSMSDLKEGYGYISYKLLLEGGD